MKIDDAHRDHIQAVQEWLEKNVRVYPTPSRISLRQIQLDSNTLRGEALLFVGDTLPGEALTLRMGDDFHLAAVSLAIGCAGHLRCH